jgi:hypothetical protein
MALGPQHLSLVAPPLVEAQPPSLLPLLQPLLRQQQLEAPDSPLELERSTLVALANAHVFVASLLSPTLPFKVSADSVACQVSLIPIRQQLSLIRCRFYADVSSRGVSSSGQGVLLGV